LSVCRIAQRVLSRKLQGIQADTLWDLYSSEARPTAKRYILRLIADYSRWTALPYILRAYCANQDDSFLVPGEQLRHLLYKWNSTFAQPTSNDLQKIDAAIADGNSRRTSDPLVVEVMDAVERYRSI
jgi:hypothetical protein